MNNHTFMMTSRTLTPDLIHSMSSILYIIPHTNENYKEGNEFENSNSN